MGTVSLSAHGENKTYFPLEIGYDNFIISFLHGNLVIQEDIK